MSPTDNEQSSGLTVVASASGMMTAQILKSKLESAGIAVVLDYESAGVLFGITMSGHPLSQVRLLVAHADAEEAKRILDTPPPPGWEEEALDAMPDQ